MNVAEMGVFETIAYYFNTFSNVRYAMIVGVLIALCSSLLGVTLVLKRFSFIGDGLSRVAFGATTVAGIVQTLIVTTGNSDTDAFIKDMLTFFLPLLITVGVAILLLRTGNNSKINGDAAVAMISVGSLSIGYLLMNVFSKSANLAGDVCSILFGSTAILTLKQTQVRLCVVMSVLVIAVFLLFYHKIFAVTFDENFASATGAGAKRYNLVLSIVIAAVIVLAMNLVGALLISALVIFPALSAMQVFKSFRAVTIASVVISMVCAALGILVSIVAGTPVGSTIVAVDISGFLLFALTGLILKR